MALSITSPGVQIKEVDISQTLNLPTGTNVLVAGFAPQGPTDEIITITSLSEWQSVFGLPTNAAERYFYQSVVPLFNTNAIVNAYRLPYGSGLGTGFGANYGALVYPVTAVDVNYNAGANPNYGKAFTTLNAASANVMYLLGEPTHLELTPTQYAALQSGTAITWSNTPNPSYTFNTDLSSLVTAGLIVINTGQTSVDNAFQGYYMGIADNSNINPASNFTDILTIQAVATAAPATYNYVNVPTTRLAFALSSLSENNVYNSGQINATTNTGGSISFVLESSPQFNIGTLQFNDTLIFGLFKLNQSPFNPTTTQLSYTFSENYVASVDYWRQINNPNGGKAQSFFIQNVDQASPNIQVYVNSYISHKNGQTWLNNAGTPSNSIRTITSAYSNPSSLLQNLSAQFGIVNINTYNAQVAALAPVLSASYYAMGAMDALFPIGAFASTNQVTKDLGSIPTKLNRMFDIAENVELYPIDISIDAGISTIFADSQWVTTQQQLSSTVTYFDDTIVVTAVSGLQTPNFIDIAQFSPDGSAYLNNWLTIVNLYAGFAGLQRKDHLYIADLPRNIFVQGSDYVTLNNPNNNFPVNIFLPIQNCTATINTSYACVYGNWMKVFDNNLGNFVWVPSSGFAATAMANTDSNYEQWYAPAGFTRGNLTGTGVVDIALYPKQKQRDQLYNVSVNPITFFPNEGFVIYGQKTLLRQPSAFDRINVRRLFLYLEKATYNTVKFFVFEPNTVLTRTRVVNVLTPLFTNAQNTEGLYDFLIVCDERNNPPNIIDANELVVDIYLKPVRTAEFILVNFYATRTSQNFSELVGGTA